MATLDTPLADVVGGRTATPLEKAFGMQHRRRPAARTTRGGWPSAASSPTSPSLQVDDEVTVVAEVRSSSVRRAQRGSRLEVVVGDGTATLQLVFFGVAGLARSRSSPPARAGCSPARSGEFRGRRQLVHPEYLLLRGDATGPRTPTPTTYAGQLIPVYPATKAVRTWTISRAVEQALRMLDEVPDPLDADVRARRGLMSADAAIRAMHRPDDRAQWAAARRRLAWDEALGVQLALAQRRRAAVRAPGHARGRRAPDGLLAAFDARLPFELTAGQREVGETVAAELAAEHPMHRLLQGEVGSGKTVVALRAMLQVVDAGGQAALLAPTEVLAAQHARTIDALLGPLAHGGMLGGAADGTRVALLTGSLPAPARKAALLEAAGGSAGIVVGTHALIQEHVPVRRPRARRRRRAAPLRRRAARRPARQGRPPRRTCSS